MGPVRRRVPTETGTGERRVRRPYRSGEPTTLDKTYSVGRWGTGLGTDEGEYHHPLPVVTPFTGPNVLRFQFHLFHLCPLPSKGSTLSFFASLINYYQKSEDPW